MKIDKVIFSSSDGPEYSPFWNMQSLIWSSMGIEPICLLWGNKSQTNASEKYGKVYEMNFLPNLPKVIQITWSKFDFIKTDPNATWMIGDIDMLPLQRKYFIDNISQEDPNSYLHLNAAGISLPRRGKLDAWVIEGPCVLTRERGEKHLGADLAGHYHVSKGQNFIDIYELNTPFEDRIKFLTESHRFGCGVQDELSREEAKTNPDWYYWCAEEQYSSEKLWQYMQTGKIAMKGYCYNNSNDQQRVDRSHWDDVNAKYKYTPEKVENQHMVDIHCARPYQKQESSMMDVIKLSGVLEK